MAYIKMKEFHRALVGYYFIISDTTVINHCTKHFSRGIVFDDHQYSINFINCNYPLPLQ